MTRSKFLELVSAYIDGEISQSEEEQLREEIKRRPERALVLAAYERMNAAASKARFPRPAMTTARKNSRATTFVWCLSCAAVCAAVVLAVVAAIGGPSSEKNVAPEKELCVLSGDFAVKAEAASKPAIDHSARADFLLAGQICPATAIRQASTPARTAQAGSLKDFSIQPACQQAIQEAEVINCGKFRASLPLGVGAICIPTTYDQ